MPPPGHRHNRIAPAKPALERARGETMARVAGVDLPREKRGEIAVTYIYGIGKPTAINILKKANIDGNKRVKAWTDEETARVREIIERELKVEGDLRREISMNVKRLMDIGSYRGIRHRRGLPVRGQRTHTNARTRKGKTDRKSTRLNSSHLVISYAVFCLKKKKKQHRHRHTMRL